MEVGFKQPPHLKRSPEILYGNETGKDGDFGSRSRKTVQTTSVSAVIVNFNGGHRTLNCLKALCTQAVPLAAIIVIDNGSDDGSPDRVRSSFPGVKVFELGENRGLPAARNVGLQLVNTHLVLLIDTDVYVEKDCLSYLLRAYHNDHPTVVCPRICLSPEHKIVQADGAAPHFVGTMLLQNGNLTVKEAPSESCPVGACTGSCMLVHRESVLALGGFDEMYFFHFEDLEFSVRLRSSGHRIICEPAAVVYHDRGSGSPGLSFRGRGLYPPRRAYLTMRNRLLTMLIHYRIRTLLILSPALALYELACLLMALLRGWGVEWVRAWLWQLRNSRAILQRRQRAQRARALNDRDLLVGGPLPLAPGFIRSHIESIAVTTLSMILNKYWRVAQRWIG